ncbi:hypothetical protein BJ981_007230 [Sphaerisporangium krabiense]|uniref:Glycosyltransferase 2-like domain-containing protein n=2 Tax=Sphaerisporangium krabiense TaxID=763782 RepID=A0A7W8ZCE9_9ACTN|nr:hypothetical protein [Sphaerisporangium krabiense]
MMDLDYVLPLRWDDDADPAELTGYLRRLAGQVRVIVVDGSPPRQYRRHARAWEGIVRHVPPRAVTANGKVGGVLTGVRLARSDYVVIADDDVRYDAAGLAALRALLEEAEVVRPQNHFDPLPWHARWDTARTLVNRAFGADHPGTLGVRRSFFERMGGYDGEVLFENLELVRTVLAHGGRERHAPGLYVRRLPPDARRFWAQRVRQAYDDLAQPARMAVFLAVVPGLGYLLARGRLASVLGCAALTAAVAEAGRRRAGGRRVFPASCVLFAPVWVLERGVCSWLALYRRGRGGVRYAGRTIRVAAHSARELRARRQGGVSGSLGARKPTTLCEPSQNGLVADRPHRHSATVARPGSMTRPS